MRIIIAGCGEMGFHLSKLLAKEEHDIVIIDKDPDVDTDAGMAAVDAEVAFQNNVSERWKADMGSDVKLAKMIRPLTLICLMGMFMLTMVFDSVDTLPFNVKDSYVDLLQILMLTAFGAYFAGRSIEKVKK